MPILLDLLRATLRVGVQPVRARIREAILIHVWDWRPSNLVVMLRWSNTGREAGTALPVVA